ncbi:MAG TPA: nuclear transport factor 2 family protein [Sphingomonadaceae bacterium]|nr:nuclear transport factor 2 family protein [Sphingomonadaceae bacterium]
MKYRIAALAAVLLAGTAQAATLTPADIAKRHVSAGGNIDTIMADYADDAVVLQDGKALQGKPEIRAFFEKMFPAKPAGAAAAPAAAPKMQVKRIWQEGDIGYLTWEMGPVSATEEFLVRDGKILVQAVFMRGGPPAPAK